MAKIENTTVYPLTTPSADDFIIGTDTSDDNRTVSFSISTLTAAGGLQGLQSVLDTSNVATQNINLTGNITVVGTVAPTTITAAASTGTAGQVLSSTGTGIQWVAASAASCCSLDDTLTVGNTTTQDINTTGNVAMSGAGTSLAFTGGSDITLAVASSITTEDDIILGSASVLNFNATSIINDALGGTGTAGQILTVNGAGTGVVWGKVPTQSTPTLQEVLTSGNTAVGVGINLTATSPLTLDGASNIVSAGNNTFTGTNTFSASGTLVTTAGVVLSGSLWDGASTGTSGQVLTSTATGVSWAAASVGTQDLQSVLGVGNTATNDINLTGSIIPTTITDGVASVGSAAQYLSSTGTGLAWATLPAAGVSSVNFANTNITSLGPPIVVTPNVGNVLIEARAYGGGSLRGYVPDGGNVTEFLQGDGTWAVPAGAAPVTSVSQAVSGTSTGPTDAIKVTPSVGLVTVASNAFDGSNKVGHVPDASGATGSTDFLRADGTWAAPVAASSGFGGLQTFMLTQAKTPVVANNYMTLALNNVASTGDRTVFSQDLGASSPAVMAGTMTDGQHVSGCFLYNPTSTGCVTSTPAMKCCDVYFQYLPEFSGHNFTLELWKTSVCTSGTYTSAGSATVSSTGGTLTCGSITFVSTALQTLQLGEAYFITVNQDATLTGNDFLLNLTVRYEMVA